MATSGLESPPPPAVSPQSPSLQATPSQAPPPQASPRRKPTTDEVKIANQTWGPPRLVELQRETGKTLGISIVGKNRKNMTIGHDDRENPVCAASEVLGSADTHSHHSLHF